MFQATPSTFAATKRTESVSAKIIQIMFHDVAQQIQEKNREHLTWQQLSGMACSTFGRGNKENLYNIFPFLFVPVHYQQIAIIDFIFHYCFGEPISVRSSGSNTQCIRLENEKDTHVNMNFGEHEPK